jgi:hypothetical protein
MFVYNNKHTFLIEKRLWKYSQVATQNCFLFELIFIFFFIKYFFCNKQLHISKNNNKFLKIILCQIELIFLPKKGNDGANVNL